jgi:bifunctional DNA-binding transcriptional regulator/antitoxin component of YhaV-PrlF toxin-antitoxin module
MTKSTVSSKGQTTILRAVREELGIRGGDVLEWDVQHRQVRLRLVGGGFLSRRGMIRIGGGSVAADIVRARRSRGSSKA